MMRPVRLRRDPRDVLSQTHADLVVACRQYLERTGWLVLQTPKGGLPGYPGWPDLMAFKCGRVLLVEVKVGRDKLSADQLCVGEALRDRGFAVLEVRSLEDAMRAAGC